MGDADWLYCHWAQCLQAEIYDYFGDYPSARTALEEDARHLVRRLKAHSLSTEKPLFRQQMWTLLFYSHCHYRNDEMEEALELMMAIRHEVDRVLPLGPDQKEPSFGLRARIAYSIGQVHRHRSDVKAARDEFLRAIELTRSRLENKRKKYAAQSELFKSIVQREQRNANYVIAKAFAFGLAWAAKNAVELHRARASASAACTLLEAASDPVHTALARVVYAEVLRATSRPVPTGETPSAELMESKQILEPLVKEGSALSIVPKFLSRAQYELAATLHASGKLREASILVSDLLKTVKDTRWRAAFKVLLIRIFLSERRTEEALRMSEECVRVSSKGEVDLGDDLESTPPDERAAILISKYEALMEQPEPNFELAHHLLACAEDLLTNSPVAALVCILYRSRCFVEQGNLGAARREFGHWQIRGQAVETGALLALADEVAAQIQARDGKFIALPEHLERPNKFDSVVDDLKRWAITTLYSKFGESYLRHAQGFLGRDKRTVQDWQQALDFSPARFPRKR